MIRFLWAMLLEVSLLLIAVFHSEHVMGCLLCGAALIVVFQLQSLTEEQSRSSLVVQGILSLLFSLLSGHFASYLIFYEMRLETESRRTQVDDDVIGKSQERRETYFGLRIVWPGVLCFFVTLLRWWITGDSLEALPVLLWHVLLLTVCAAVFLMVEFAVSHYLRMQWESAAVVRGIAVNELYEKKLNQELRMKNYLVERNARMEERENISRNIHNSVGHTITAAVMTLDAAELLVDVDTGKAKERMITAKERMKEGLSAVRLAVRVLDKENDRVPMGDFLGELSAVADNFVMDTELTVKTDVDVVPEVQSLPKAHTEFLNGAVRELLTNGVKHGGATRFLLSITADSAHLQVRVKDNGTGDFSEENKEIKIREGFGLKKMISYVKKCGGDARFTNENGFCAVLTVPLYREETDGDV